MNLELQSMAIDLPPLAAHPNRAPFRGVLTLIGVASDRAPSGAHGHRVLLTRAAAERALPTLLGMGLDYAPALDRHDAQRKVGIITEANIVASSRSPLASPQLRSLPTADSLEISGYIFARDFPEIVRQLRLSAAPAPYTFGMSYEITEARVQDSHAAVWTVTDFTFTGAAILRRDRAAYRDTWIELIG